MYAIFFLLGAALYAHRSRRPGRAGHVALFVLGYVIIISMYGGGFATIPAYLRDLFGTMQVGAIHGRLLTAWSAAGVAGPVLVNYIREYQIAHGVAKADAYTVTMYIMAGLLIVGLRLQSAGSPGRRATRRGRRDGARARVAHMERPVKPASGSLALKLVARVDARRRAARVGRVAGVQEVARSLQIAAVIPRSAATSDLQ